MFLLSNFNIVILKIKNKYSSNNNCFNQINKNFQEL